MCKVHTCEQCFHPLTQSKKDNFQYDNTKSIVGVTHKQSSEIKKERNTPAHILVSKTFYLLLVNVTSNEWRIKYKTFIFHIGLYQYLDKNHFIKSSKFHVYNFAYTSTKELEFTGKEQNRNILVHIICKSPHYVFIPTMF